MMIITYSLDLFADLLRGFARLNHLDHFGRKLSDECVALHLERAGELAQLVETLLDLGERVVVLNVDVEVRHHHLAHVAHNRVGAADRNNGSILLLGFGKLDWRSNKLQKLELEAYIFKKK